MNAIRQEKLNRITVTELAGKYSSKDAQGLALGR